jgi:hypothetical protein
MTKKTAGLYQYKFEIINPTSNQSFFRENTSEFSFGDCWGYNRFFKIENLQTQGFISDDDSINVKFYVRAITWKQRAQDLAQYVNSLKEKVNDHETTNSDCGIPIKDLMPFDDFWKSSPTDPIDNLFGDDELQVDIFHDPESIFENNDQDSL